MQQCGLDNVSCPSQDFIQSKTIICTKDFYPITVDTLRRICTFHLHAGLVSSYSVIYNVSPVFFLFLLLIKLFIYFTLCLKFLIPPLLLVLPFHLASPYHPCFPSQKSEGLPWLSTSLCMSSCSKIRRILY